MNCTRQSISFSLSSIIFHSSSFFVISFFRLFQPPTQIEPEPPDLLDPFGTDDGELSMELATPLMPTSAININVNIHSDLTNRAELLPSQAGSFPLLPHPHPRPPDPTLFAGGAVHAAQSPQLHPHAYPELQIATADDHQYYVDPPSIPLPPSPPKMLDGDHNHHHHQHDNDHGIFHPDDYSGEDDSGGDSPTLSQIELETSILEGEMSALTRQLTPPPEVFVADLRKSDVEMQLSGAQRAVEDGEVALERLEGLARVLHPP